MSHIGPCQERTCVFVRCSRELSAAAQGYTLSRLDYISDSLGYKGPAKLDCYIATLTVVLVRLGCYNNVLQIGQLTNTRKFCFKVERLEARS